MSDVVRWDRLENGYVADDRPLVQRLAARERVTWDADAGHYIAPSHFGLYTREQALDQGFRTMGGPEDVPYVPIQAGARFVDLMAMEPGDFDWPAIARTLSRLPRFNAWIMEGRGDPWSVAQHCVVMCLLALSRRCREPVWLDPCSVPEVHGSDAREAGFLALIHDAPEAYTGDLCSPLKAWCPQFKDIEAAVFESMLLDLSFWPTLRVCDEIKALDLAVGNGEARALFDSPPWADGPCWEIVERVPCWTREEAEAAWLRLFEVLR